jgi:hypothetical protein
VAPDMGRGPIAAAGLNTPRGCSSLNELFYNETCSMR